MKLLRESFSFAIFQLCFYLDCRDFYRFNISDIRNHSIWAMEKRKLLKYYILLHKYIYIHTLPFSRFSCWIADGKRLVTRDGAIITFQGFSKTKGKPFLPVVFHRRQPQYEKRREEENHRNSIACFQCYFEFIFCTVFLIPQMWPPHELFLINFISIYFWTWWIFHLIRFKFWFILNWTKFSLSRPPILQASGL